MATAEAHHRDAPSSPPEPPQSKFSRYRSVRKANQHVPLSPPPIPPSPHPAPAMSDDGSLSRSKSRYHRQRPAASARAPAAQAGPTRRATDGGVAAPPLPPLPPAVETNLRMRAQSSPVTQQQRRRGERQDINHDPRPAQKPLRTRQPTSPPAAIPASVGQSQRATDDPAKYEAKQLIAQEAERQKRVAQKLRAEKLARIEAEEAERRRAEEEAEAERERERKRIEEEEEAERRRMEESARQLAEMKRLQEEERLLKKQRAHEGKLERRHAREQKVQERERVRERDREVPRNPEGPPLSPAKTPTKDKFGFLKRKKGDQAPSSSEIHGDWKVRQVSDGNGPPATIKPGGGGVVPGIDAPISAVNAGDRRVLIECTSTSITLPITPTTTTLDLIRSASTCLSEPIDVKTAILLENFIKVGLQRPLRKYEHVRDVMNSWDDDGQNSLVLVNSVIRTEGELTSVDVPKERPGGFSCWLYISQKPGKWAKKWILLRSDGQMQMAKDSSGKDATNICHLSDFDIYTPTPRKISKQVKPPKKICYAIKSQQKSSMFLTTTTFVHFLCTNESSVASQFYHAVQSWRSWYLVNVMGEGKKHQKAVDGPSLRLGSLDFGGDRTLGTGGNRPSHRRSNSMDSHYQLGSFKPLMDLSQFDRRTSQETTRRPSLSELEYIAPAITDTKTLHSRKMSTRTRQPPPSSFPAHFSPEREAAAAGDHSPPDGLVSHATSNSVSDSSTFAPTGLLGRTYSQRQKAQRQRDVESDGPFTSGPSLLSGLSSPNNPNPQSPPAAAADHSPNRHAPTRSASIRKGGGGPPLGLPRPLVDLTPTHREPPQHARKGRGFVPDPSAAQGGLVESATSLENLSGISPPPATDWRRPAHTLPHHHATPSASAAADAPTAPANNHTAVPASLADAFTGRGLLAHAPASQGDAARGHGVVDGSHAGGRPLLDVSERSRFAKGSLLEGVERRGGGPGPVPVIERERVVERVVGTGEGVGG